MGCFCLIEYDEVKEDMGLHGEDTVVGWPTRDVVCGFYRIGVLAQDDSVPTLKVSGWISHFKINQTKNISTLKKLKSFTKSTQSPQTPVIPYVTQLTF